MAAGQLARLECKQWGRWMELLDLQEDLRRAPSIGGEREIGYPPGQAQGNRAFSLTMPRESAKEPAKIVDLGCLLGATTVALGKGLQSNTGLSRKAGSFVRPFPLGGGFQRIARRFFSSLRTSRKFLFLIPIPHVQIRKPHKGISSFLEPHREQDGMGEGERNFFKSNVLHSPESHDGRACSV
jgi:hypothetical protein